MDLLLHLLSEEELDVEAIPVARICDRYLEHLEGLDRIDVDAAGEFLVMASVLMRIKSRSLLPAEVPEGIDDDDLDPRFELVRQLIQYRRFKRVAEILAARREQVARSFSRGMHPELADRPEMPRAAVDVSGASIELLFATFARLLKETRTGLGYVVTRDETPMEVHLERVEELVPPGRQVNFRELFPAGSSRGYIIGVFLALLELMKRGRIDVSQGDEFGEIEVMGREGWDLQPGELPAPPSDIDALIRLDEEAADTALDPAPQDPTGQAPS